MGQSVYKDKGPHSLLAAQWYMQLKYMALHYEAISASNIPSSLHLIKYGKSPLITLLFWISDQSSDQMKSNSVLQNTLYCCL